MATRKQFLLRLDPALYTELESWAAAELRSVNAQMEYLLRQAVNARKGGRRAAAGGAGSAAPAEAATGAPERSAGAAESLDEATTGE